MTTPQSSDAFLPPSAEELAAMLPQYDIHHLIAAGGMGAVYAGSQRALDRPVAIKVLPPGAAKDGESIDRFRTEAKAMARLIHPNIPAVYDFDVSSGYCYLVMEFIDGRNVHELVTQHSLTPELTCNLIAQVCEALQFAHQRGIVHGDIKPSNLLVTQEGVLKLADFGLAQLMDAGSRESGGDYAPMGTPEYAAPELWQPDVVMDHRADLYSLGCVFYEMLTGAPPEGSFQLPAGPLKLDPKIDAIISRCMQQQPAQRYQSAAEIKKDVDAIRHGAAIPATTASSAKPAAVRVVRPGKGRLPSQSPPRPGPVPGSGQTRGPRVRRSPNPRGAESSSRPLLWLLLLAAVIGLTVYLLKFRNGVPIKVTPAKNPAVLIPGGFLKGGL